MLPLLVVLVVVIVAASVVMLVAMVAGTPMDFGYFSHNPSRPPTSLKPGSLKMRSLDQTKAKFRFF